MTTYEIREAHDVDTNATAVSFKYGDARPADFLKTCTFLSRQNQKELYRCEEKTVFADGHTERRDAWVRIDARQKSADFWR